MQWNSLLASNIWAVDSNRYDIRAFIDKASALSPDDSLSDNPQPGSLVELNAEGEAVIHFRGLVLQGMGWLNDCGLCVADPIDIKSQLRECFASEDVKSIRIVFDSPGGATPGVANLADLVASSPKPVVADVPDLCGSAAYWVASQASRIEIGQTAIIGAIGTYTKILDVSEAFGKSGIKAHCISSHELKGAGEYGTELTENQRKDIERNIKTLSGLFSAAVQRGRQFDKKQVEKIATGQVWIGAEAIQMGLADQIANVGEFAGETQGAQLRAELKGENMEEEEKERLAACEVKLSELSERVAALESSKDKGAAASDDTPPEKEDGMEATLRNVVFAQFADRVTPEIKSSLADVPTAKLPDILAALPKSVRTEPVGGVANQTIDASSDTMSGELVAAADFVGVEQEHIKALGDRTSLSFLDLYAEQGGA